MADASLLIDVEYEPSTRNDRLVTKRGQEYHGVVERPRDGITCLAIRAPGASRSHYIEVGQIESVGPAGRMVSLSTPNERWRTRAQEVRLILEGQCEGWAAGRMAPTPTPPLPATPPAEWRPGLLMQLLIFLLALPVALFQLARR